MKIQFERSGGFTGIPLRASIDSDLLDADESKSLIEMVNASDFFNMPATVSSPGVGADRFNYKLSIEMEGQSHTVEFSDASIPERLRPLVQKINFLARSTRKG